MKGVFLLMFCLGMSGGDINGLEMKRIKLAPEPGKHKGAEESQPHLTEVQRDEGDSMSPCVLGGSRRNVPRHI